jgi:hypothetical protein
MPLAPKRQSEKFVIAAVVIAGALAIAFKLWFPYSSEARWQKEEFSIQASNACINNLRLIDAAKQQWALEKGKSTNDTPSWADLQPYCSREGVGEIPKCPNGGHYTLGKVGANPTCSFPSHYLP